MLQKNDQELFGLDRFKPNDPARSYTIPGNLYYDADVFAAEKEAVFYKSWNFVCHVGQIEAPGAYATTRVGDQNIAVVRGRDGVIRAFHNVCSHRAHKLLEGQGKTRAIVCPYHAWTYELDGRLRSNAVLETVEDFRADEFCLKPVLVEVMLGFVWINLDLDAAPLAEQSGRFADEIRSYCADPETLRFSHRMTFEVKANWKNVIENFQECYHCPPAHPALVELIDHQIYRTKNYDICSSHIAPSRGDNSAFKFDPAKEGALVMFGAWYLWPNVAFNVMPGRRNISVLHMMPSGPETTYEHWDFFFEDGAPNEEETAAMEYLEQVLQPEDIGLVESVQSGLHSRVYSQGRLVIEPTLASNSEHGIHHFQTLYYNAMTADRR